MRDHEALAALDPMDAADRVSGGPSALAGMDGDTSYPFDPDLISAWVSASSIGAATRPSSVFLSTRSVFPCTALGRLALRRAETGSTLEPLSNSHI